MPEMIGPPAPTRSCVTEGCGATYKNHYWGSIKAQNAGWFTKKNGEVWCPDHTPEWVERWRAFRDLKTKETESD